MSGELPQRLTPREQWAVLEQLVDRLAAKAIDARIYLIGGAAAGLAYYPADVQRSASTDIDATFTSTPEVEAEALALANELGLREDWFNRRAEGFIPPTGEPQGRPLLERSGVEVVVAPPEFLLAMKLRASRPGRDDEDIAVLVRLCGMKTVAECEVLVDEVYLGEEEIPERGYRILGAVFGAYELTRSSPPIVLPPVDP